MSQMEESAFGLTAAELEQIQYLEVLKRRRKHINSSHKGRKTCFSDKLSIEAQIAMQLALEDTQYLAESTPPPSTQSHVTSSDSGYNRSDAMSIQTTSTDSSGKSAQSHKHVTHQDPLDTSSSLSSHHPRAQNSFSELFQRNHSARMQRDITDENYSEERESKRALGGGKVESAMEIIEIIQHGDEGIVSDCTLVDDEAISELARINAMEKCEVWMQATVEHRMDPEPDLDLKEGHK